MKYEIIDNVKYDMFLAAVGNLSLSFIADEGNALIDALLYEGVIALAVTDLEYNSFATRLVALIDKHGCKVSSHVELGQMITDGQVRKNNPVATLKEFALLGVVSRFIVPL